MKCSLGVRCLRSDENPESTLWEEYVRFSWRRVQTKSNHRGHEGTQRKTKIKNSPQRMQREQRRQSRISLVWASQKFARKSTILRHWQCRGDPIIFVVVFCCIVRTDGAGGHSSLCRTRSVDWGL